MSGRLRLLARDSGTREGPLVERDLVLDVVARGIPEIRDGAWQVSRLRLHRVRKERAKRIAFLSLRYVDRATGRIESEDIVAKLYGQPRHPPRRTSGAEASLATLGALWTTGFRAPSPHRVPRPYGFLAAPPVLLQGLAPGRPWSDALSAEPAVQATESRRAADWLLALHAATITALPATADEADACRARARELAGRFSWVARTMVPAGERLAAALAAASPRALPSHGDFHPRNVFLSASGATVIDFDTFGSREPAFDVGYAIGQLLIASYLRLGGFVAGAFAARAFWSRYASLRDAGERRVALHVARALLQGLHYDLCTLRNGRVDLLAHWPAVIDEWIDCPDVAGLLELLAARAPRTRAAAARA